MKTLALILVFSGLLFNLAGAYHHIGSGAGSEWIASEHYYDDVLDLVTQEDLNQDGNQKLKRTVDFGMSRGYSGIRLAKHLMALQAAQLAAGPGRKRRSPALLSTGQTSLKKPDSRAHHSI